MSFNFFTTCNTTIGTAFGRGGHVTGPNPFKRDQSGAIPSITAIGVAVKADPRRARVLCEAAGEPVAAWFPENPA